MDNPRLLALPLRPLHLRGSPDAMISTIARAAHVGHLQVAPGVWRLERLARRRQTTTPLREPAPADEIVVQASKRDLSLSSDPVEVFSVDGRDLARFAVAPDTNALAGEVAILQSTDWGPGREKLFLRGIADSSFTGSSPALVGEYLGDQRLIYNAPDPDLRLHDVDHVEVLAGPQGTLYGAGSLGGIIRIEPNSPVSGALAGSAWMGLTTTAHGGLGGDGGGLINMPLVGDKLTIRALGYAESDAGYIDDTARGLKNVNRSDIRGGRVALRWNVATRWKIDLIGVAQRIDNLDAPYSDASAPPLTRSSAFAQPSYNLFLSGGLVVSGEIGPLAVRSTSGLVHQALGERFEVLLPGMTGGQFDERERATLFSQETRLSGSSQLADWVLGGSFVHDLTKDARDFGLQDVPAPLSRLQQTVSEATVFGQATKRLAGRLSLTLGGRLSWEQIAGFSLYKKPPFNILLASDIGAVSTEHHVAPSAALSYRLQRGGLVFLRFESGYRPGGFTVDTETTRYLPDAIETVELGFREGTSGKSLMAFSMTGAASRWRNIQADVLSGIGEPAIANIGDGRVVSLDAALEIGILRGLRGSISGFLADSRLDAFPTAPAGGSSILPNVAKDGVTVTLDYRRAAPTMHPWRGGIRLQHVGPSIAGIGLPLSSPQGDYTTVVVDGGVTFGHAELTLDITNLLDSRARSFDVGTPFAALMQHDVTQLRPRTARLGLRFAY